MKPTRLEKERRRRIRLAVAAFAYEFFDTPIMSDAAYDKLAGEIMPMFKTGNPKLDEFFARHFTPDTGLWVRRHPEPESLRRILREVYDIPTTTKPADLI